MKKLAVVDISSFIFRAFFAVRPLHAPDGTPVNAVYGVLSMLFKLLGDYRPTHVVLARDLRGGSFRNEMFEEYKANRSEPPEDLVPQFALIEKLIEVLELPNIAVENYEADDVIGSIVTQWKDKFDEIGIISSDKDLMQFIGDNIKMVDTQKGIEYGREEVFKKLGVYPEQIVDYLSMVGDTSDNIPGMKGIGAKGAAKLLAEYGTLENCIANRDKLKNKRVQNAFAEFVDDALVSKKLVSIVTNLPLPLEVEKSEYKFRPTTALMNFLQELGLKSFIKKIEDIYAEELRASASEDEFIVERESQLNQGCAQFVTEKNIIQLSELIKQVDRVFIFSNYTQNYQLDSLAIGIGPEQIYVFDLRNQDNSLALQVLTEVWRETSLEVVAFDVQNDLLFALLNNCTIKAKYFSISQAHFVVNSGGKNSLDFLTEFYLQETLPHLGKGERLADLLDVAYLDYLSSRVMSLFLIVPKVQELLEQKELLPIYKKFDAPLFLILAKMEKLGVLINQGFFKELEQRFSLKLAQIEEHIFKAAGCEINLKSPKQVSELLFNRLNLPVIKKTKTGYSTDSSVLEQLKEFSDIPALILDYREIEKLLSTYVKVIPQIVWEDGRVHSHFTLNVAATGRLSSVNPNLQNIPVRSENGKLIRRGFVARPGTVLLSADYSQIELRLLAHFSEDSVMVNAFLADQDIHAQTAAEVEQVPLDQVTSEQRSRAKAVNFGLMYGQSAFGLAGSLGISRQAAKEYIEFYFARFGQVKAYLDSLKEFANDHGYVETMHGRKRFIPEIHSKNKTIRAMAERVAINSPIQGTAADIIKLAMIKIDQRLASEQLQAKLILQVHDELIFEVPDSELNIVKTIVRTEMESIVDLKVPLKVDMGIGVSWFDLK